jgi:hypothetical protein
LKARVKSKKLLLSATPGEVTVGNILFVELKNNVKKPMMIHVDVCTKLITGLLLNKKSEEECTKAILDNKADYQGKGKHMKQLVFDREPGIVPSVGLLASNATKAGVRAKFGYPPPN